MRLISLKVEHFGPIRAAELSFGPGLNVLFGPNDLGKSTLAEAIRAALLLPVNRSHATAYVPWGTAETPGVTLELQYDEQTRYRIKKEFGPRGLAELHRSLANGNFDLMVRGRGVDGELCKLLRWGIVPPGEKGKPRGFPESYLTHVLLGRQAEVMKVFEHTLSDDALAGEGKARLEAALEALAEPPEFRQVRERVAAKVAEAFTEGGQKKRDKGSPWVRLRDQIEARTRELQALELEGQNSAHARDQVQRLTRRRDEQAQVAAAARERRDRVAQAASRAQVRQAAEARARTAREALEAMRKKVQAAAGKEQELARLAETLRKGQAAVDAANLAARTAEEELQRAQAQVRELEEAHARSRASQRQELEGRRAALQSALEAARARLAAAREAERQVAQVEERRQQEQKARERAGELEAAVAVHAHGGRLAEAVQAETRAREAVSKRDAAEAELATREARLAEATRLLAEANAACDARDEELRLAGERLQRVQSEAGPDQRALRVQELTNQKLQAEAARAQATQLVARATAAQAAAKRVSELEGERTQLQGQAAGHVRRVEEAEARIRAADAELERAARAAGYLAWSEAAAQVREAEAQVASAERLREQAEVQRKQAATIEAEVAARSLPTPEQVESLRSLDRDLHAAEARLQVGLTVTLTARRPFAAQGELDGVAMAPQEATPGAPIALQADREVRLALGDLVDLEVRGGRPEDQKRAADLRARWNAEARPLLSRAGVTGLTELEPLQRKTRERSDEAARLRREAETLDARRAALGDPAALLAERRQLLATRLEALGGRDPQELAPELADLGDARRIEALRAGAASKHTAAAKALEAARLEAGKLEARLEALSKALSDATQAREAACSALGDTPEVAVSRGQSDLSAADARLEVLAREIRALEQEGNLALAQAREALNEAEERRNLARKLRDERQADRDRAERDRTTTAAQLEQRRAEAGGVDLAAAAALVASLRQELAQLAARAPGVALPRADQPAATLATALERARTEHRAALDQVTADRTRHDEALQARDKQLAALGGDWRTALTQAESATKEGETALAAVARELSGLDTQIDPALGAARTRLADLEQRVTAAQEAARRQAEGCGADRAAHAKAEGELALLRQEAASVDLPAAESAATAAETELSRFPPVDPSIPCDAAVLRAAEQALAEAERLLGDLDRDLYGAQIQLQGAGGTVIEERRAIAKEALERAQLQEQELEQEYRGWRHLQATLDEVGRTQSQHLGQVLVGPVTERFRQLTGGRYGGLNLGPELDAARIETPGAGVQEVTFLSVGTKEQLATLLRITIASQLGCVVVLDDQLAQSDGRRLEWFGGLLRELCKSVQVVVLTCRPDDYVRPEDRPDRASTFRDTGSVRVIDLERIMKRLVLHKQ